MEPITELFMRYVSLQPGEPVLLLHAGDLQLARWLVDRAGHGQVTAWHTSYRALAALAAIPGLATSDTVYPDRATHGAAAQALVVLPKGRDLARALLWTVAQTVVPGGRLYLAGLNESGAKSAIRDAAALFENVAVLGYRGGARIACARRSDALHLPDDWRVSHPWQPQMRAVDRPEGRYTIITMPGVFSWDHLDDGTALLLDHLAVEPGQDVLDIGCGYGIIGLVAARAGALVTMVDDNLLAVRCAQASVKANRLADRCTVLPGDVTSSVRDRQFDLVLTNPPFHQGIDVTTGIARRIIREACEVLRPGGRLCLVANRFLPYDRVMRAMFGAVATIAETRRFRVLEAVRPGR